MNKDLFAINMKRLINADQTINKLCDLLCCCFNDCFLTELVTQYGELLLTSTYPGEIDDIPDEVWEEFWNALAKANSTDEDLSKLYDFILERNNNE